MSASTPRPAVAVLTLDEVEEVVRRALAPLRAELERIRSGDGYVLVPYPEAARRLGFCPAGAARRSSREPARNQADSSGVMLHGRAGRRTRALAWSHSRATAADATRDY